MDTRHDQTQQYQSHQQNQISTKTMVFATVGAITIGGPLVAMMGFTFLATMTFFVITSPLLIIFSPLLIGAGFVLIVVLSGFALAGVMALAGLFALGWVFRLVKSGELQQSIGALTGKLVESGENIKENVKETGKEWASNLKQTTTSMQNTPDNRTANQA
uniref:oleosin-like n=1 Tax=Erigeron canadensis TaxID=72917 RepID=UPI001CB97F58|nr:oleosin-like [Erigeron canadensis]